MERNRFMSRFEHKNSETCTTNVLKSSQKSLQSPSLNLSTFIDDQGQFISAFSPSVCPAHRLSWSQSDVWHMNLRSVCCDFSVTFSSFPPDCGTWSVSLVETNSGRAWRVCAALALIVLATYFKYLPSATQKGAGLGSSASFTWRGPSNAVLWHSSELFLFLWALKSSHLTQVFFMYAGNQVPEPSVLSWSSTSSLKLLRLIFVFSGFSSLSLHIMNYGEFM